MSVKFCVLSGAWPVSYGGCASNQSSLTEGGSRLKLSDCKHRIEAINEGNLIDMRDGFDNDPDNVHRWIWRLRTKWTAGCCSEILAINFSPADPTMQQDIYIERLRQEDPMEQRYVFYHRIAQYRFLLPVERLKPACIFQLPSTISNVDTSQFGELQVTIGTILSKFMKDHLSNGIAITLRDETYIWLKAP
jgi:hypothetical protein